MLQYTIQHLCFNGSIQLETRRVPAHARDPHLVSRKLLTRRTKDAPGSQAELFALELFPLGQAISLGQLRIAIKKVLPDFERFKHEFMRTDLIQAGMLSSTFVRTPAGKERMQEVRFIRKFVDRKIDHLLQQDKTSLFAHLSALGSNVVLLKKETRDKLRGLLKEFPELRRALNTGVSFDALSGLDSFTAFDSLSLGDSFDAGGDFGGFGGGDLGGGGDGGDW